MVCWWCLIFSLRPNGQCGVGFSLMGETRGILLAMWSHISSLQWQYAQNSVHSLSLVGCRLPRSHAVFSRGRVLASGCPGLTYCWWNSSVFGVVFWRVWTLRRMMRAHLQSCYAWCPGGFSTRFLRRRRENRTRSLCRHSPFLMFSPLGG